MSPYTLEDAGLARHARDRFGCEFLVHEDKRGGSVWRYLEPRCGPDGLC